MSNNQTNKWNNYIVTLETLAKQFFSWIDPFSILYVAKLIEEEDEAFRMKEVTTSFQSYNNDMKNSKILVSISSKLLKYLDLTTSYLNLLQSLSSLKISKSTLDFLSNLSFEGTIEIPNQNDTSWPDGTVFLMKERLIVATILLKPMKMLTNVVCKSGFEWENRMQKFQTKDLTFYSTQPGPFPIYLDAKIAQSYGFHNAGISCREAEKHIINIKWPTVTLIENFPIPQERLNKAKEVAIKTSQTNYL